MHRNLSEFRIQVYRQDGELSVYLFTPAWDVADATEQAERLVSRVLPKAEVWSEGSLAENPGVQLFDGVNVVFDRINVAGAKDCDVREMSG
jgi:hypothetical protein